MAGLTEGQRAALLLTGFCVVVTGVRLVIAAHLELAPDEAYYWLWSRDLRLSYPDHPPLVAYLIRLGTRLVSDSEFGVRSLFVLSSALLVGLTYALGRECGLTGGWAVVAATTANLLPIVSAGSLIATPDTTLGLAWLLGTLGLARLRRARCDTSPWTLAAIVASVCLGLWSKHSAFMLVALSAVGIKGASAKSARLVIPSLVLGLAAACPALLSDLLAEHGAARSQLSHLLGQWPSDEQGGALAVVQRFGELCGGQIALVTPLLMFMAGAFVARYPRDHLVHLLAASYLLPVGATALAALGTHPEQNWASLGHPTVVVLACLHAQESWICARTRTIGRCALLMVVAASICIHLHALVPFFPLPPEKDPVSRLHGWKELRTKIVPPSEEARVLCDNYGLGAEIAWQWRQLHPRIVIAWQDRPCPPLLGPPTLLLDEVGDPGHSRLSPIKTDTSSQFVELRRRDGRVVRRIEMWVMP